jgi:hypothetical protein
MVTIAVKDHGVLVRLASSGILAKVNGCGCNVFNQGRVRMELEVQVRHRNRPVIVMVEVD